MQCPKCNRASFNKKRIDKLRDNAIFQLSLSSKELFHSNFLCWLATDRNTKSLFEQILVKLFCVDSKLANSIVENPDNYLCLREYKNFDFCICEKIKNPDFESDDDYIPGQVLLVLENKFKSVPYEQQLQDYQSRAKVLNQEGRRNRAKSLYIENNDNDHPPVPWKKSMYGKYLNGIELKDTQFVLLSLVSVVCGFDISNSISTNVKYDSNTSCEWKFVSYLEYASFLKNYSAENRNRSFSFEIIDQYATFITDFVTMLNDGNGEQDTSLPTSKDISSRKWNILSCRNDLKEIRMNDIWQKIVANMIGHQLVETIKNSFGKRVHTDKNVKEILGKNSKIDIGDMAVSTGFSRGTAIIEAKIKLRDNLLFGIQVQGNDYKRLLETIEYKSKSEDIESINWHKEVVKFNRLFRYDECCWIDPKIAKQPLFESSDISPQKIHLGAANIKGFGGYGKTFVYQSKKISTNCRIETLLSAIKDDLSSVMLQL